MNMKEFIACAILASIFGFILGTQTKPGPPDHAFTNAQCATIPTGRSHQHMAEVVMPDGVKAVSEGTNYHEWATVCERKEWK